MAHQSAIDAAIAAIVTALNVAAMTSSLATGGIYANVPQGTTGDYIRVGEPTETRLDTMGKAGKEVSVQVHCFSTYKGPTKVAQMLSKAVELLHYQTLTIAGHTTIAVQYETGFDAGDEEAAGHTVYHYVGIFKAMVQQS